MSLTFANIAGFWALLGIPLILAIHFLQRQSQLVTISTLFLLEQMKRESVSGRKFERLRNSIPLWLQLLAVLGLTWLLVQPRWVKPESIQRIAVVLDGSASMSAFREELSTKLDETLAELSTAAQTTEYVVLDSRMDGEPVYNGTELPALIEALKEWKPLGSNHDPGSALRVGRSLAHTNGLVIFATDHQREDLAYGAKLLAVGEKRDNVGFSGIDISPDEDGVLTWRASVRNYSDTVQSRPWLMQSGNQRTAERTITLQPGETRSLQGKFPEASEKIVLRLQPDDFTLDDELPAVFPKPKPFSIAPVGSPKLDNAFADVLSSFENIIEPDGTTPPDLILTSYDPLDPTAQPPVAVVLLNQQNVPRNFLSGRIAAENHPYVEGLNWQGLIARQSPGIPRDESDTVLVWQGERPLIFFRTKEGKRQLFLNFDFTSSNAARLPAFIVLLHRFVEDLRQEKIASKHENYEIRQYVPLSFEFNEESPPLTLTEQITGPEETVTGSREVQLTQATLLKSPDRPGFFEVTQGETRLLLGAAHFADTREADFSQAASHSDLAAVDSELVEQHTEADSRWQLWLILLLFILVLSWFYLNRPAPTADGVTAT